MENKKTIALGAEDYGLCKPFYIGQVKEHAMATKSVSDISTLWHQLTWAPQPGLPLSIGSSEFGRWTFYHPTAHLRCAELVRQGSST